MNAEEYTRHSDKLYSEYKRLTAENKRLREALSNILGFATELPKNPNFLKAYNKAKQALSAGGE